MRFLATNHIAIAVPGPLREAEAYYQELFGLAVSWREPVPADAFRLSVVADDRALARGVIDHVGLQVDVEKRVRERAKSG